MFSGFRLPERQFEMHPNETVLPLDRWRGNKSNFSRGVISFEQYSTEESKIRQALLDLVGEL